MAKATADTSLCKSCGLCVNACPVQAIASTKELNKKGYEIIRVDTELCTGCGQCYKICPDYVFTVE